MINNLNIGIIYNKVVKKLRGSSLSNSRIHSSSKIESGSALSETVVGRHSYCGYDCTIINAEIGPFCSIANYVSVGGASHPIHFVSTSPVFLSHKDSVKAKFARHEYLPVFVTTIGADVWIGEGALIKAGVHIGHGAIVGMGAVVTSDVAPYAIVGGNPARVIRFRFDTHIIERLLEVKWWDFSDERLHELGPVMNDPKALLEALETL